MILSLGLVPCLSWSFILPPFLESAYDRDGIEEPERIGEPFVIPVASEIFVHFF